MTTSSPLKPPELPAQVEKFLNDFLQAAQDSFGKQLRAVLPLKEIVRFLHKFTSFKQSFY